MKTKNQEDNQEQSPKENQEGSQGVDDVGIQGITTIEELMDILFVNRETIVKYIKKKKIPAYKIERGKFLISTEELIKTIKTNSGNFET